MIRQNPRVYRASKLIFEDEELRNGRMRKKTISHFFASWKLVEEVNEESKKKKRREEEILSCCFALYCTVIRLLLLTGILSMLLIAEILLSLIYGLKA